MCQSFDRERIITRLPETSMIATGVVLDKHYERPEHIGLSLVEAKTLLLDLQRRIVTQQIAAFLATRAACPSCDRPRGLKDHKTVSSERSSAIWTSSARGCDGVPASTTDRHRQARWSSYCRSTPRPSWSTSKANGRAWSPMV
jgi:hypothetical protein